MEGKLKIQFQIKDGSVERSRVAGLPASALTTWNPFHHQQKKNYYRTHRPIIL